MHKIGALGRLVPKFFQGLLEPLSPARFSNSRVATRAAALGHGLLTVPRGPTEGLPPPQEETFGHGRGHGQETVPQPRYTRLQNALAPGEVANLSHKRGRLVSD